MHVSIPARSAPRHAPNWLIAMAVLGVVVATAGTFGRIAWRWSQDADLAKAAANLPAVSDQYRKTGLPWEAKDLARSAPEGENAAPALRSAFALAKGQLSYGDLAAVERPLEDGRYGEAQARLDRYEGALGKVVEATNYSKLDFHRDWDMSPARNAPEFADERAFAKLLADRAELKSARGDAWGAARDLTAVRRLGELVGQEPAMLAMLNQVSIGAVVDSALAKCAAHLSRSASGLAELEESARSFTHPDFDRALKGEAYSDLALSRNLQSYGGLKGLTGDSDDRPDEDDVLRTGLPSQPTSRAQMSGLLAAWVKIAPLIKKNVNYPIAEGRAIDGVANDVSASRRQSAMLAAIVFPVFTQAGEAIVQQHAQDLTTDALLKAMTIHAETGHFPSKISQIPGHWIDPFNGGPLLVHRTSDGIRIYSVGRDLKDNGGEAAKDPARPSSDVVAAYPPIEQSTGSQ